MLCFLRRSHVYFDPIKVYMKGVKLATIRIQTDQNECDDEVRPRQQALQCNDYGRSYGLSDHMIDFCVVKVFMALLETKKKLLNSTLLPINSLKFRSF